MLLPFMALDETKACFHGNSVYLTPTNVLVIKGKSKDLPELTVWMDNGDGQGMHVTSHAIDVNYLSFNLLCHSK